MLVRGRQTHTGFEVGIPLDTRALITPIQILPGHLSHESATITAFPGDFKALWDTGATNSLISNRVAKLLELPSLGEMEMVGVNGTCTTPTYLAGLRLPNDFIISHLKLSGFSGSDRFDILLGMDIISQGDFLVCTAGGVMHFSFQIPSLGALSLKGIQKARCSDGRTLTAAGSTVRRQGPKVGRNDLCSCGSGKKSKNCCGNK